jgi:hypothetical protein
MFQRARRVWLALAAAGLLVGLAMLTLWDPATSSLFPPCPFRLISGGFYCPGCGSLRATHRLLHGDIGGAFRLNPLLVVSLPFLAYATVTTQWPQLRSRWFERIAPRSSWPMASLVIILLYWGLRNLPFAPFSWLAPRLVAGG